MKVLIACEYSGRVREAMGPRMNTAAPSIKDAALASAWASVKQIKPTDVQGLPSKTWSDIPVRVRAVLVMLGAATMDDPREVARRSWGSLSDKDREGIAAVAREMRDELKHAACLF
jgi:hypothetical protein